MRAYCEKGIILRSVSANWERTTHLRFVSDLGLGPQFPLYIPSKGRSTFSARLTTRALEEMGVAFNVIVEEQEYQDYIGAVGKEHVLVLDPAYQRDYETLDDLGDSKSKGPGAARNFAWDHSSANGHPWHWVMDDNIRSFYRLHQNQKIRVGDGTVFRIMEDFCLRYSNVAMAGPNYESMLVRKQKHPPFITNTRIYSCNLIRNDIPFRWRGRYNEDTILSLDMLKAGWCTVQFNAFLQDKVRTQVISGGNTQEFYSREGTRPKSEMQVAVHPDVSRLVWKFNRWHHHVDYSRFKQNRLIRKRDTVVKSGVDNYGMKIINIEENE